MLTKQRRKVTFSVIAQFVHEAMTAEVLLCPKPGLVDAIDTGAHNDMDLNLFLKSADVLKPFFKEIIEYTPLNCDSSLVLPLLRSIGLRAEQSMFRATGGVNTHKGQIFSLGILSAAAIRVTYAGDFVNCDSLLSDEILNEAKRICTGLCNELYKRDSAAGKTTHGEELYQKYAYTGIRGEAEKGYPVIKQVSLPVFGDAVDTGLSEDEASLECLIHLMSVVEDSTVLYRCGPEGLKFMHDTALSFLAEGGMFSKNNMQRLSEMNHLFICRNISPGGCADLLAVTLFLHRIERSGVIGNE